MADSVVIDLPEELECLLDEVVDLLGFGSREEFALAAVRRMLDEHAALIGRALGRS